MFDWNGDGAAYAGDKGNGGGKGGGNGGGKSDKAGKAGKSANAGTTKVKASGKAKSKKPATTKVSAGSTKKAAVAVDGTETLHPSELGKMNGAMHANINAVLAHIRNGQTTNGPVGLLAGLAIADAAAAESLGDIQAMEDLAAAHTALNDGLGTAGYATLDDYLAAKADGTATPEDIAAIDGLIDGAGGLTEDGTALATTAPTDEELAEAHAAASGDAEGLAAAEDAFVAAWNKDGDPEQLLAMARERLEPYAEDIAAAVAETQVEEPVEEVIPEGSEDSAEAEEIILEPEADQG
ncbi:MAG: hypothetical protein R3D63_14805 [Paracoccaceae bacterium]